MILFQRCCCPRKPFTDHPGLGRRFAKVEALGDAFGHTGGLQPLIDTIHTVIAFDDFSCLWFPLGGTPWAGSNAAFASYTEALIHKHNAVLWPFLHGAGWTDVYAPGILTVEAGYEDIGCTGEVIHQFGPHRNDLTKSGAHGEIVFCLTV